MLLNSSTSGRVAARAGQIARLAPLLAAVALPPRPAMALDQPASIRATWLTEHGDARIRFAPCGAALCGKIVWLKEPNDSQGRPKSDVNNSDPAQRSRRLMGLTIFADLRPVGDEWKGRVYNSQDGATYDVAITRVDADHASVKGCVLGGLFCGSETWTRG